MYKIIKKRVEDPSTKRWVKPFRRSHFDGFFGKNCYGGGYWTCDTITVDVIVGSIPIYIFDDENEIFVKNVYSSEYTNLSSYLDDRKKYFIKSKKELQLYRDFCNSKNKINSFEIKKIETIDKIKNNFKSLLNSVEYISFSDDLTNYLRDLKIGNDEEKLSILKNKYDAIYASLK